MRIPDNYDMWERHEDEQEQRISRLPHCDHCHEPIQDEYYFEIDGEIICEECLNDYKKYVEE